VRILVTGATGLVGGHVVARLATAGHQVTALARRVVQGASTPGVQPVAMDLLRPSGLTELLRGHDAVVHAAGLVADVAGREALRAVHVEGTTRLAEAAIDAGVRVFVHISTLAVHATPARGEALDETAPLRERFPGWMRYAEAKRDAERVLRDHAHAGALRVCVLRPGIVLGAGDRHTTPRMLAALRRGGPVQIGSGAQRPPCVCAGDLADAAAAAIRLPFSDYEAFVLSGPEPPTQAELWRWHARAAGLAVPRGHIPVPLAMAAAGVLERVAAGARRPSPASRFDVFALSVDVAVYSQKATKALGWHPRAAYGEAILAAVQDADSPRRWRELHPQGGS
jgi:nucleoside-diphosphate-sugar epimerase